MPSFSPRIETGGLCSTVLVAVEILDEGLDAALVVQLGDLGLGAALVGQHDAHARVQEGQLAQPVLEVAKSNSVLVKISVEGMKVTSVPRWPAGASPTTSSGVLRLAACGSA